MKKPEDLLSSKSLKAAEIERYGRHLILPEVGMAGQQRLKEASVLLVGLGGLGSPLALYLAAAGVGCLGLIDFDRVDSSNLQRQVLYGEADVGRSKVEVATERLQEINPHTHIEPHELRLDLDNGAALIERYDVVVDGSDNASTRYLVNDLCVMLGKPDVWGAVARFEGQVSIFGLDGEPCYRCLFPEPPPPGLVPSCAEGGVLGVLPGMIGAMQANEALKLILEIGEPLIGRLAIFDALKFRVRELKLSVGVDCPLCRQPKEERRPIPYQPQGCGGPLAVQAVSKNQNKETKVFDEDGDPPFEVDVTQLKSWIEGKREILILDVREPQEYKICRIEGSRLMPLAEVPEKLEELDKDTLTVVHCHHGGRSAQAVMFLRQNGFRAATNLAGGINAWSVLIDPEVPRY